MTDFHKVIKIGAIILAILIIVGIVGAIVQGVSFVISFIPCAVPKTTGNSQTFNIKNNIHTLDIDLYAVNLEIAPSLNSDMSVESNYKFLSIEEKDNKLVIKDKKHGVHTRPEAVVKLFVPKDFIFDETEINAGAGKIDITELSAKDLTIDFGAQNASLRNVVALKEAKINAGVGKLVVENAEFQNLNLDMGIGELVFNGTLFGKSTLELGIGSCTLNLIGSPSDYKIYVEKGIGEIKVAGETAISKQTFGTGAHEIFVEGGIGAIKIDFSSEW